MIKTEQEFKKVILDIIQYMISYESLDLEVDIPFKEKIITTKISIGCKK